VGTVTTRHKLDTVKLHAMLASPQGGLAKTMLKRAVRVQAQARRNLSRPPRRIDTGALRADIQIEPFRWKGYPAFRVGTNKKYARFVHDGTGIFGPEAHYIVPRKGKFLVFTPKGELAAVFTKKVKGMEPNPFLRDALSAARL
jgi:hypothetical protein